MSLLNRYIAKTILASTMMVLLVLLGLYTFMDFIGELDELGKGSYQLTEITHYMALSMPKRIYELLPIAALLGSVLGLGSLASQSELIAMRAAGVSIQKINHAVLIVAVALMIIAVFVGEVVRPSAEQKAREVQSMAKTGTINTRTQHGFWTRDGAHFNHIKQILPDGRFKDLSIYEFDADNKLRNIIKAKEAHYENEQWVLNDVVQSIISDDKVENKVIHNAHLESTLNLGLLSIIVVPPEFLPVWNLLAYIQYLEENLQATEQYQMAFWMKVMMPISSAVMVFLAVPFIFGPLRSSPVGGRILAGALVGVGFHLFNQSFQHIGLVFGIIPWLSAAIPTLIFAFLGWYFMRRIH